MTIRNHARTLMLTGAALLTPITSAAMPTPTQADMDKLLQNAAIVWGAQTHGEQAEVAGIRYAYLNDCQTNLERAGWSDLVTRIITINSACQWNTATLWTAVLHEYGHMLLNSGAHSMDPHSVMYFRLDVRQEITAEDRAWVADKHRLERPTILLAHSTDVRDGGGGE